MSVIKKMRRQYAVYWPPVLSNNNKIVRDKFGKITYGTPVEISCRWEDKAEEFLDGNDTIQVSNAVVYVDRDVVLDGVLLEGELSSGVVQSDPYLNEGVQPVRRYDKLPTFKATEFLRTVYL